jgi:hypothetical protein
VELSLRLSANNKAPGLNGIPYELWKVLDSRHRTRVFQGKPSFDVVVALQVIYNDIEDNRIVFGTGFSKSWMVPLYKKNNPADIANYRHIFLLTADVSTEGADRKFSVLGCFQRIPYISVSSSPIHIETK